MKRYKLLKDYLYRNYYYTFTIQAGEVLEYHEQAKQYFGKHYPLSGFDKGLVENAPEWFEEVKEETTDLPSNLELFRIADGFYTDGRATETCYRVKLIGKRYDPIKPQDKPETNVYELSTQEKQVIEAMRKAREAMIINDESFQINMSGSGSTAIYGNNGMWFSAGWITGRMITATEKN